MNIFDALTSSITSIVEEAKEQQEDRESDICTSEWVGVPKSRTVLSLTLIEILGPFDGTWGERYGYVFTFEKTCNTLLWWSAGKPGVEIGETAEFKVTVKEHTEYKGTKQTIITRVKRV